jgi:cholesterol oxidase
MGIHARLPVEVEVDVVVVGSGFGGSAAALRLTEKGYRVAVLEAGRRFDEATLPRTSWRVRSFFWAPRLGCYGIQRISLLKDVMILSRAGVGGGSLVYANTLYEPPPPFYQDPQWAHITDWQDELAPFYDQAGRMLGVVPNPTLTPSDEVIKAIAEEMGVGDTFHTAPGSSSANRAWRSKIRSSAGRGRRGGAASSAASA